MTSLICPHGHYGSCTRCTLQREAKEAGEAIGSEAGALVAGAIAEPIRALAAERDVLLSIVSDLTEADGPSAEGEAFARARAFLASRETQSEETPDA